MKASEQGHSRAYYRARREILAEDQEKARKREQLRQDLLHWRRHGGNTDFHFFTEQERLKTS